MQHVQPRAMRSNGTAKVAHVWPNSSGSAETQAARQAPEEMEHARALWHQIHTSCVIEEHRRRSLTFT